MAVPTAQTVNVYGPSPAKPGGEVCTRFCGVVLPAARTTFAAPSASRVAFGVLGGMVLLNAVATGNQFGTVTVRFTVCPPALNATEYAPGVATVNAGDNPVAP